MKQKKILILHTGGTFGMELGSAHLASLRTSDFLDNLLKRIPELSQVANIDLKILCNIDSSDASLELWSMLAKSIVSNWNDFDGFVVIHGTDTMAYTASALAFFLEGLTKSVVLTGSQRPLSALRNDARLNMIDAVELATYGIPEVMVCFDSKVHLGTRVTKYSNEHLHAFRSYNAALVAEIGVNFRIADKFRPHPSLAFSSLPPRLNLALCSDITTLVCAAGTKISHSFIQFLLDSFKGIILKGFGAGNLPLGKDWGWLDLCESAFAKKIPIILTSQCQSGSVSLQAYENGRRFEKCGVISSKDMTFEAASVKLMIMLGRKVLFEERNQFYSTPLAHECHE